MTAFETTIEPAPYGKSFRLPRPKWTDERTETLKRLWSDGQSASIIADELGGLSRSAVLGKVDRLGLDARRTVSFRPSGRKLARQNTPRPKHQARERRTALVFERVAIPVPVASSLEHQVGFFGLEEHHCRFPLWTDETPAAERFFCGAQKSALPENGAYCDWHHNHTHNGFPQRKAVA